MKKVLKIFLGVLFAALLIGTFVFLWQKTRPVKIVYAIEQPKTDTLRQYVVATGKVQPRDEVEIKPQISGIISDVYKEAGEMVRQGEVIATVKVVPEMGQLSSAESRVSVAEISLEQAEREYKRTESLHEKGVIADEEAEQSHTELLKAEEELRNAKENLEIVKGFYDKGYWYPGQGALTATKEQVQAAFYQGRIAMLFDAASNAGTYEQNADFQIDVIKTPLVEEEYPYTVNVVTNALFIPANAKHPEEAVEFIKFYTTDAAIEEIIKSGRLPSTKSMQDAFDDPVLVHLMTNSADAIGYQHLQNLSSEMASYLQNDIISSVCSGIMTIDQAVERAEELRLDAIGG